MARLARLDLDDKELLEFQGELNALLGHFEDIQGLQVGRIDPKPHAVSLMNVWAEDRIAMGLDRVDVLRNAPLSKAGLFVVPAIIED